jgi:hypothetical protein
MSNRATRSGFRSDKPSERDRAGAVRPLLHGAAAQMCHAVGCDRACASRVEP